MTAAWEKTGHHEFPGRKQRMNRNYVWATKYQTHAYLPTSSIKALLQGSTNSQMVPAATDQILKHRNPPGTFHIQPTTQGSTGLHHSEEVMAAVTSAS